MYLEINHCGILTTYTFWSIRHWKPDREWVVGAHTAPPIACEFESYFVTFGLLKIVEIVENCGNFAKFNRQNYYIKSIRTFMVRRWHTNPQNISLQIEDSVAPQECLVVQLT